MSQYHQQIKKIILCCCLLLLTACGRNEKEQGEVYQIYGLNSEETAIVSHEYRTETTDPEELLSELLNELAQPSEKLKYKAPVSGSVSLASSSLSKEQLTLDFDKEYYTMPVTTEVLTRAAIVRTLSQISGVGYISFQVHGEPLVDTSGAVVGVMSADTFIENDGNEINTYEKATLRLYFANEDGTMLRSVSRDVVYSSNISMERLVVDELLSGPQKDENAYAVINPATTVQSVTVKDGTCYVSFSAAFWNKTSNVSQDVMVYAIVNSLAELSGVNKVQITVDTQGAVDLKEHTDLLPVYERNLDIVE